MKEQEFRIYHVSRHLAKHNYELDDRLYGSPLQKNEVDWPLINPKLYLQRLKGETLRVTNAIDDMVFLLNENGASIILSEGGPTFTLEEADAHVFHKFHTRQFEYVEKLSFMLQSSSPAEIKLNLPKAHRQLNVLLAAQEDLAVTMIRFSHYLETME